MPLDWTPGGDLSDSGSRVSEPGWYHFGIANMQDPPVNKDGSLVTGVFFRLEADVLNGTVPSQVDKAINILWYDPSGDKDGGAFGRKKMDKFLLAVGLATREQIESKAPLKIDVTRAVGRQFVAKVKMSAKGYAEFDGADIYHVDDPAVKDIPKNADALKLIPPALRWVGGREATNGAAKKEEAKVEKAEAAQPASSQEVAAGWDDV